METLVDSSAVSIGTTAVERWCCPRSCCRDRCLEGRLGRALQHARVLVLPGTFVVREARRELRARVLADLALPRQVHNQEEDDREHRVRREHEEPRQLEHEL